MNIIVTGSNRGIGAAIAKRFCELSRNGKEGFYYPISRYHGYDVRDPKVLDDLLNDIDSFFPTVLINNAGIVKLGNIIETSYDDWIDQFNVNVHGVFNCSKAFVKFCIKNNIKEGKIINIASTAGLDARPGRSAYAATKAAIINYSLSLSSELNEYGIKVYCVCPGAIDTDMRHYIMPDDNFDNMMKKEELAEFICKLIFDGKNLDGQILKVKL